MPERMYEGRRAPGLGCVVDVVEGAERQPLPLRLDVVSKAKGFDWGNLSAESAQLAAALLFDACGDVNKTLRHYQDFKRRFVSNLTPRRWIASRASILLVLGAIERDTSQPPRGRFNPNMQAKRK